MSWTTSETSFDAKTASREIIQSLQEQKTVLFCGAGISMDPPATLPDWKSFRDITLTALATTDERLQKLLPMLLERPLIAQGKQGLAPEVVASQVHARVPNYFQCLAAFDHDEWNQNHLLIANLAQNGLINKIVTTNFDCLIEKALASLGVKFHIYRSDSDFSRRGSESTQQAIEVFKLHGCLTDTNTIVATVEQEAVGLSKPKAEVLRQLWAGRTAIFWGYSGADLKVQQDYLQLVASAHEIKHVFWNLHSTDTWKEQPLPELNAMIDLLKEKGHIQHLQLRDIFRSVIGLDGSSNHDPSESENLQQLNADRTQALQNSVQQWAQSFVLLQHSLEIFGHLLRRVGEVEGAWHCFNWLSKTPVEAEGAPGACLAAIAHTYQALLSCRLGDLEGAEFSRRLGRQLALEDGSIDLMLQLAMVNSRILMMQGFALRSLRPWAFAHRISQWATPAARQAVFEVQLDTIEMFIEQGLYTEAKYALEKLEDELRDVGFLEILCRAKAAHARLFLETHKPNEAVRNIREAREIAIVLGLERWELLFRWREFYVTRTLNGEPSEELLAFIDKAIREKDVALFTEAILLLLDVLDVLQIDAARALEILNLAIDIWQEEPRRIDKELNKINSQYVDRENSRLTSRLLINKARCYQRLKQDVEELSTIEMLLPRVSRAGYEKYAAESFARYTELKQLSGCPATELILYFEAATRRVREAKGHSAKLEEGLAQLRKKLGKGQYPEDFDLFLENCFEGCGVEIDGIHDILAKEAQLMGQSYPAPGLNFVDSLTIYFGESGKFMWSLSVVARIAESSRQRGNTELALKVATNASQISELLGDNYYIGVFHNQVGLVLVDLNRKADAANHFDLAVASSDRSGDNLRLVHYLFNAAQMYFDLAEYDKSLQLYRRLNKVVGERDDIVAFGRMAWNFGKTWQAIGILKKAKDFLEAAEFCAWVINDQEHVLQIREHLAKVYWDMGEFESSIAYRAACELWLADTGKTTEAAAAALLIGNTYDEKLNCARDAAYYYTKVIAYFNNTPNSLVNVALERLLSCIPRVKKQEPWLYDLLVSHAESETEAEQFAVRIVIHAGGYSLWHFELRSWAAWMERNFSPVMLGYSMMSLGKSARALHEFSRAHDMFSLALGLANVFKGVISEELIDKKLMDKLAAEARAELESYELTSSL